MKELHFSQVRIQDPYWSPRLTVNAERAIFHQWNELEKSGCIDNFRLVTGDKQGFREGWFFADSDAHKWLDAASRVYAITPSERLSKLMDGYLDLIGRAQETDGYLFTYNQLHFAGQRWIALQVEHELYCLGHMIEGCLSYDQATGASQGLVIAEKAARLLVRDFMEAGPEAACGHQEIEIALLRLHQVTGEADYIDLAGRFLERRGRTRFFAYKLVKQFSLSERRSAQVRQRRAAYAAQHPQYVISRLPPGNAAPKPAFSTLRWYWNALSGRYAQQYAPIRKQTTPVGHAVRFGYQQTAIARLYRLRRDESLLPALQQSWKQMVERHLYVTGGVGAMPGLEGFGADYALDPKYAYAETCAAIASLLWNWEMALITNQACYSDLLEWQMYNAIAVGMGVNGDTYLYNNPLACYGGITRRPWYAVPCCPSNLSRTWASLGQYIYAHDPQDFWVHQYISSQVRVDMESPVEVSLESGLPHDGRVIIRLNPVVPCEFSLHLRIPAWSMGASGQVGYTILVNQQSLQVEPYRVYQGTTAQGYDPRQAWFFSLRRTWQPGDVIQLQFELPMILRRAHPKVPGHAGRVAVTRGPLVYCLESVDNPGVDLFEAVLDPTSLAPGPAVDLPGEVFTLQGSTLHGQSLVFIPYALWANRGPTTMNVWVKSADK